MHSTKNIWAQPEQAGQLLLEVKKQEIRKTGVLEYYEPTDKGLDDVGGLEEIKTWIRDRRDWDAHWEQALAQINPQYRTPMMQSLLQHYNQRLKTGDGKSASRLEEDFIENLILPTTKSP